MSKQYKCEECDKNYFEHEMDYCCKEEGYVCCYCNDKQDEHDMNMELQWEN